MKKTEWGVTVGVKRVPEPDFVTATTGRVTSYGWKIDRHGIFALGDTKAACRADWARAYQSETGETVTL